MPLKRWQKGASRMVSSSSPSTVSLQKTGGDPRKRWITSWVSFPFKSKLTFNKLGIRILFLGNKDGIPESSYNGILKAVEATRNNSTLTVQLAINYGGWDEISRAANKALESGITHFSPETLLSFLDNPSVPSPDMIVRSAGECRLSGFMLLQSNYAEFGFYEKLWPDWDESMVELILEDFNNRTRKYGGIKN